MSARHRLTVAALALTLPLGLAACGSETSADEAGGSMATSSSSSTTTSSSPTSEDMAAASQAFGEGCTAVPADGKGSFAGMATDPVATAASNNPVLSTLVTAVTKAGLGDTLNSADAITVFAPTNDAFGKIPKATLDKVLADKATLTKVLTHHVVAGKLAPTDLAGEHETLAGDTITVEGSGEMFSVAKEKAQVVCGNVQTANATVYIVDTVLMP